MNESSSAQWKVKKERGALWTMHFMHWLCKHRFEKLIHVLLYPIAAYFLLTSASVRQSAKHFYQRVKGSYTWRDHYKQLLCFARSLVDRVLILMGEAHLFHVAAEGREQLVAAQKNGQGAILLGAHLGSFEAAKALVKDKAGLDVYIVAYHEQSKKVRAILDEVNPEMLDRIIDPSETGAVFKMREVIESGGLLAILSDRVGFGDKTTRVDFLGGSIDLPAGPYMLAAVLHCPVFCFFAFRVGYHEYQSYTIKLAEKLEMPRENRDKAIAKYAQEYANVLAKYAKKYPYHWFNFYEYWPRNKREGDS